MRRWTAAIQPALMATVWLLCLFAPVLSTGRALANRDIAIFHLPLRTAFRELAAFGLPAWNPWLHGGEPILSNPSYAAFYPPSWLAVIAPLPWGLSLLAVLHTGIAFAGAWLLARRLGCGRGAAAMAGIGFAGCGAYLSLLSAFNLFWGISWLPWVLAWGSEALGTGGEEPPRGWWRPALLAGGALGLSLLNGEPATAGMSGLALLALAASAAWRRPTVALRVLVPFLIAGALAAVQLLPTLGRLGHSSRQGLGFAEATEWSLPPERLVEVVFPHFFGAAAGDLEGIFFGWTLNDRHYPYLESLYPGLLLAVLGTAALLRGGIPRRGAWALAVAGGFFLALGRHNPVYGALRRAVPPLAVLRYPEKFAALAVLALAVAGVLGWQRLADERRAGRREAAGFPLAVAGVALAAAVAVAMWLQLAPAGADRFIASHGDPELGAAGRAAGLVYLRRESRVAVATAASVVGLLALCRWGRTSERRLQGLALFLLATDLWHYGHSQVRSVPADLYRTPPPLAAALASVPHRIFVPPAQRNAVDLVPLRSLGDPRTVSLRNQLTRLYPYSALLWNLSTVFEGDFELMLTRWGSRADEIFRVESRRRDAWRFLGLWNVSDVLFHKTMAEQEADLENPAALPLRRVANPQVLPRFRFTPRVSFHPSYAAALAAARALDWKVARDEQCVGGPAGSLVYTRPPHPLGLVDEGGRIRIDYRAEEGAFLIAALTFDEGWKARLDGGKPIPTYPTAACQLGVALPAGEHSLLLEYRQPLLREGAAITLITLAGVVAALVWPRRERAHD